LDGQEFGKAAPARRSIGAGGGAAPMAIPSFSRALARSELRSVWWQILFLSY